MKLCKITIRDEVWCHISGLSTFEHESLWNKFGIFKDGYFWSPKYKMGVWDGKIRFYERNGKTYTRLLDQILPEIAKMGYEFDLIDNRKQITDGPTADITTEYFSHIIGKNGKPVSLRPYQAESANKAIQNGDGFCILATSAGKTFITALLSDKYSKAGHKTITIVPSDDLVTQTAETYKFLQLDTGIYSGSEKKLDHPNIVATWQSLQYNPSILKEFGCIIWDEAHGCAASVAAKLLNTDGAHIRYKFGVTGTFPKGSVDKMSLHSSIGPILVEVSARWLMDNGYITPVEIHPIELNEAWIHEEFPDYTAEKSFTSRNERRMNKIADIVVTKAAEKGNTLVLVNSISFGKKLAELIKGATFLYGESEKDVRKEHYEMFNNQDDVILIASSGIASTGLSIDGIMCLIMVDAGKSFIRSIQSIGRSLRLAEGKNIAHVVDIYSKLKWGKKHHKDRLKYYAEAQYPVLKKSTVVIKD